MYLKLFRAAALGAALSWTGMMAQAQTSAPAGEDPVVARVNGTEIKRSDLVAAQSALAAQYREIPLQSIFQPLLREMIKTLLIVRAARAQGLHDDPGVKRQVEYVEGKILEQAYLGKIVASRVTEEVLRKDYEKSIADTEFEVRARHILVKTEAEAVAVIEELRKDNADFAELAQRKSTGTTREKGGDLGFFGKNVMAREFSDAAFELRPGDYTRRPVKTQFGWHVIKVEQRRPRAGPVPSFDELRDKLANEMTNRVINHAVGSLHENAKIEIFGLDGSPPAPAPTRIRRVR